MVEIWEIKLKLGKNTSDTQFYSQMDIFNGIWGIFVIEREEIFFPFSRSLNYLLMR